MVIMKEKTGMKEDKSTSDSGESLNEKVIPVLCRRLSNRGLMLIEIKRLAKDIINVFGQGGLYNAGILNRRLERLGWEQNIVDNYSFELILYYLECEGTYTVEALVEQRKGN
jgi:hypothetical protein